MSDIELSAKLDRWIDDNTVDSDFIAHPDFVYDKLLELETEIKKLQAENAELQDKLEDEGFVLVVGREEEKELENLRKENAELKEQTNKKIRKVLCEIGTEFENDTRINKKINAICKGYYYK